MRQVNLQRKLALSSIHRRMPTGSISLQELTGAFDRVASVAQKLEADPVDLIMAAGFYSDRAPRPPYDHCTFDDKNEAADFAGRVLRDHSIQLTVQQTGPKLFILV